MEHWDLLPGVDPKNYLYNRGFWPCRYVCHVLQRRDFAFARLRKPTRPKSCKESFVCWVCSTLLPWWQTEHTFGMAHLSEMTHCLARIYIPSFKQCRQIRATLARRSLCGTGVAPARQDWCFPRQENVRQKKKRKREKEERKTFRSERTVNFGGQRVNDFWTKKSSSFLCAFFEHVEASTSPRLGFALCLYPDKLSLRRATPRRFWLSKTDLKTAI